MNIYAGNLNYRTTEQQLRDLFSNYGTVDSVRIITDKETRRSKGFAFVEMPNNSEAQDAINNLDGTEVFGRNIKLNEAREREARR